MASYTQRGKLWSVRFYEDGKLIRLSGFKTKKDAQRAYEKRSVERLDPKEIIEKKEDETLISDVVYSYLDYAKQAMKESSYVATESRIRLHILPHFERVKLSELTPKRIMSWQQELAAQGLSAPYIDTIRTSFVAVWNYTAAYMDIGRNPFPLVKPPRDDSPVREVQFYTLDQWKKFISVVDDPTYHLFFSLLYYTGMRRGEAECLTPQDFDSNLNTIRINKTLTRKSEEAWKVTTPKTKSSIRTVAIPESLAVELMVYMASNGRHPFIWGEEPLRGRTTDRRWKMYQDLAELPHIRLHDLRHSHASFLLSQGVSIVAVSHRLGHKSTQQTLDTYSHMMPSEEDQILRVLDF